MSAGIMQTRSKLNGVDFIGVGFPESMEYAFEERACWNTITKQIQESFSEQKNVLISLTWFGPQFNNNTWQEIISIEANKEKFDNIFFLATVDPPYLNDELIRLVKNKLQGLRVFYLGNFDSPHSFNFFAPVFADKSRKYAEQELLLSAPEKIFVNYNRKPKQHRVDFVKKLIDNDLLTCGTVTLGTDENNSLLLTIGEKEADYEDWGNSKVHWGKFGVPHDMYSLHNMDIWRQTFLYINAATEFNTVNDLFIQQDTFKPFIGLRPYVINGVQRSYRWIRANGFKTFNHYWSHIDIENADVHDTMIQLIKFLSCMDKTEISEMYQDMLPDLKHNRLRFFEFAKEQQYKMEHLFE
jgi:hypothetical protein